MIISRRDLLKSAAVIPLISIIPIIAITSPVEKYFEYKWMAIENIPQRISEGWELVREVTRKADGTLSDKYRPIPPSSKYGNLILMRHLGK